MNIWAVVLLVCVDNLIFLAIIIFVIAFKNNSTISSLVGAAKKDVDDIVKEATNDDIMKAFINQAAVAEEEIPEFRDPVGDHDTETPIE